MLDIENFEDDIFVHDEIDPDEVSIRIDLLKDYVAKIEQDKEATKLKIRLEAYC